MPVWLRNEFRSACRDASSPDAGFCCQSGSSGLLRDMDMDEWLHNTQTLCIRSRDKPHIRGTSGPKTAYVQFSDARANIEETNLKQTAGKVGLCSRHMWEELLVRVYRHLPPPLPHATANTFKGVSERVSISFQHP